MNRRSLPFVCFWSLVLSAIGSATLTTANAWSQEAAGAEAATAKLPVQRVVLFNSGVSFVEHGGTVTGDATVDLKFRVDDVNDLLKSMVVQDLGGGQVSTVTYGSRDPITKTLQSFAIDLTSDPTLGQLLAQIRGERVEVDAPTRLSGAIVGVEKQTKSLGDNQTMEVELLTLLTDAGLRRVSLDSIGRIQLANTELDAELRRALEVLALGHATDKKTVSLRFVGAGERAVRVGYIAQSPIWKTSYRLVLDEESKPFLQGWAIVQNASETDWQDVDLSLVSGRPISFVMDLYSPLYVPRPEVVPELYASLRPQVYGQDLSGPMAGGERGEPARRMFRARQPATTAPQPADAAEESSNGPSGMGGAVAGSGIQLGRQWSEALSRGAGVEVAGQGAEVGELFRYEMAAPVTLARQQSAMLPIINQPVEGEKVSIYNAAVHAQHPLDGFELRNSTDLHWMQGPVTVFDGGVYAGDARIPELPPGDKRLLSYALDLDIEIAPTSDARPQELVSARLDHGVLVTTYQQSRTTELTVKNSGTKAKTVLVEHPVSSGWELQSPEPKEKTRDVYRFSVASEPGAPASIKIAEQQIVRQSAAVAELNAEDVQLYVSATKVSDAVKDALRETVRRKTELAVVERQKQQVEAEIATIGQEQERIRANMPAIDRNTDLYNRYVKKFTEQEDQIEQHRNEVRALQQKIDAAQQELNDYLSNLNLP